MIKKIKNYIYQELVFKFSRTNRLSIGRNYIKGNGIEIGAMQYPLRVKKGTKVKYLDRIPKCEQIKIFPDLDAKKLVNVDIVGNGEFLDCIEHESLDFVIANHFIEHCQNPIRTISTLTDYKKNVLND